MSLPKEIRQALVRAFNIETARTGIHKVQNSERDTITEFHVHSIWVATINPYHMATVTLAVVSLSEAEGKAEVHKGLLLLPSYTNYQNVNSETLKAVEIIWPDPVAEALKNLNLMSTSWAEWDGEVQSYTLYIDIPRSWIEIGHTGVTDDPSRVALWQALLEMTNKLKQAYNDEKINYFLREHPGPY